MEIEWGYSYINDLDLKEISNIIKILGFYTIDIRI